MKKIFAFDMGKASIGYCVRENNDIKDLGSLIIEKDHSSVADNRTRRRAYRTLEAHKAREDWFNNLWEKAELKFANDEQLKREFAAEGDETIYNSTLLRIALIQGRKLEEWQIYKALHNAIQRRGYDSKIAWANSADGKENEEAIKIYTQKNGIELIKSEEYKYPCYYDALLLGLWNENKPNELKRSIGLMPEKVRRNGRVAPRKLVIKELTKLWEEAKKQLATLEKISVEEFLYGDYREAYASFKNPDWMQYRGTKKDWQGVLGQKIPRFDNRIIAKCKLLPKRNVCKADTIESITLTLLMQLKNFRYTNAFTFENDLKLAPFEIKQIYDNKKIEWDESLERYKNKELKNPSFTITKNDIEKVIGKKVIKEKVEKFTANISGRSSFCRRACQIMIDILINGYLNPIEELDYNKYIDKEGTPNPITKEEIHEMLSKIGKWNELHIPDNRYELAEISQTADKESDLLIGNITNPIVRNRLQIFKNLLNELIARNGKPDEVIFEFVRDGADNSLFGSIKANNTSKYMKEQEKENEQIKKDLEDKNAYSETNFLKYKLAKAQDFKCIYCGEKIGISDFDSCDIDHIFPRSRGGNDSLYNKVICHKKENQDDKKDKTPYEWLNSDKQKWAEYTTRVINLKTKLGKKKAELLTLPADKCTKLIESYNGLAETAQVARVASAITHFICGWGMQTSGQERHVFVENGSTTSKIRKIYKLNAILGNDEKKNRDNPKHHALDAICISYAMDYHYDKEKKKYNVEGLKHDYVEEKINELMPFPYTHKKPLKNKIRPDVFIYGKRAIDNETCLITRKVELTSIKQNKNSINSIMDTIIKEDLLQKLEQNISQDNWVNLLKQYIHPQKKTKVKNVRLIYSIGKLETDNNGHYRIGEYADFADFKNKNIKGQYKVSKQHKGQILYYDSKGSIKVMPVFANKSTKEVKEQLQNMGCKLYQGGEMFYSGCLVEIIKNFKASNTTYPKGIYKLHTIKQSGTVIIENNVGKEISTSAKNLTEAEFRKKKI